MKLILTKLFTLLRLDSSILKENIIKNYGLTKIKIKWFSQYRRSAHLHSRIEDSVTLTLKHSGRSKWLTQQINLNRLWPRIDVIRQTWKITIRLYNNKNWYYNFYIDSDLILKIFRTKNQIKIFIKNWHWHGIYFFCLFQYLKNNECRTFNTNFGYNIYVNGAIRFFIDLINDHRKSNKDVSLL